MKLENVSKIFNIGLLGRSIIKAVDNVSISVSKGMILGLLGESGSGKSTIAKLVLKMLKPTTGRILFEGRDIWSIDDTEYYRNVQGVFQDPFASFNPRRRILDVYLDTVRNYYGKNKSRLDMNTVDLIESILGKVGLSIRDIEGKYPHEFSGGQLQRLSIARSLLVRPRLIIADEPVSMVDASTRIDILNIFIDLREREELTSIIIGHDFSLIGYVSDQVVVLYRGQVVEEGGIDVLLDPAHPYTKMLSEAVPRVESKWTSRLKYDIDVDLKTLKTSGCVFAPRCPFRMDICIKKEPPLVDLGKSRVRCWLYVPK